ncbi:MAG: cytochrome c3 family protein, partial [Polyangiaceae bacterium]
MRSRRAHPPRAHPHRAGLAASWLLVGCVCSSLLACATEDSGSGLAVGATWQQARDVVGHRVHVVVEKIACSECHDLSGEQIDIPKPAVCVRCHEKEALIEHDLASARQAHGGQSPARCDDCHAYVVDENAKAPEAWDCMRCHAEEQGELPAVVIHAQSTCDTCHRPHEDPPAEPSDCRKCHDDVATSHFDKTADGEDRSFGEVCATCHQNQHAPARLAGENCAPCHAKNDPIIPATALFEGHDRCIACHRPHDYAPQDAVACKACHQDTPVLGRGLIPQHADCKNCHDPHAPSAGITRACVSCHTGR